MKPGYTPVTSSQISAFAYDANAKKLNIIFVKGDAEYQYSNVPQEVVDQLVKADSFGSAFAASIKKHPQSYPYVKV